MRIFHIVDRDVWAEAQRSGTYAPASLDTEGFVHFSFAHQVRRTHAAYYRDVPNLIVIEVDPARLDAELKVEDTSASGAEFPHVYGAIAASAALATYEPDDPLFTDARATTDR